MADGMSDDDVARRWHDMGGLIDHPKLGEIDREGHDYALWEKRVDALMMIATAKGRFTVDGLRRVLEDMPEDAFETQSYYERWIRSVTQNLMESGVFTPGELGAKMEEIAARGATYGEASLGE